MWRRLYRWLDDMPWWKAFLLGAFIGGLILLFMGFYEEGLFTNWQAVTPTGSRVGIGNAIVFTIFGAIATAIIGCVGFLLGFIPVIGKFFRATTVVVISLGWFFFILMMINMYGWFPTLVGPVIGFIAIGALFGANNGFVIFFWW